MIKGMQIIIIVKLKEKNPMINQKKRWKNL